jgi:hypothetical protein
MSGDLTVQTAGGSTLATVPSGAACTATVTALGWNIAISSNSVAGQAQAWVNFTATTVPTIQSSYNISSVTYVSAGTFRATFTTPLVDDKYATTGSTTTSSSSGYNSYFLASAALSGAVYKNANDYTFTAFNDFVGPVNPLEVSLMVFR